MELAMRCAYLYHGWRVCASDFYRAIMKPFPGPSCWLPLILAVMLAACVQTGGAGLAAKPVPSWNVLMSPIVYAADSPLLTPDYWIARVPTPDTPYLSAEAVTAHNLRMLALDESMTHLAGLAQLISGEDVAERITALSQRPARTLYAEDGAELDGATLDTLQTSLALDGMPETVVPRFGLVVTRADMRTFPTAMRVFSDPVQRDIDRFQESALFPGDAVAVLHESRDGRWWFVTAERYHAWILKESIALGERETVLAFSRRMPARVITGSVAETAYVPDAPTLSRLPLDMGVRLPLRTDWMLEMPVNGQVAHAAWIIDMPVRGADGLLQFAPVLLPITADSAADVLPLTAANLITQAFKFLGERYGWGHSFGTRDCSGFVSEVYRSVGIILPRNTGAQATSPALLSIDLPEGRERRQALLQTLRAGDLVYIPGHVMMVIGHTGGMTWVIHDTAGIGHTDTRGEFVRRQMNGVVVTPLEPLQLEQGVFHLDNITAIKRVSTP